MIQICTAQVNCLRAFGNNPKFISEWAWDMLTAILDHFCDQFFDCSVCSNVKCNFPFHNGIRIKCTHIASRGVEGCLAPVGRSPCAPVTSQHMNLTWRSRTQLQRLTDLLLVSQLSQ